MNVTKLRIGNYVLRKNILNEYLKILSIDSIKNTVYLDLSGLGIMEKISNLEPILFTEELVEKIGFKKEKSRYNFYVLEDYDGAFYITFLKNDVRLKYYKIIRPEKGIIKNEYRGEILYNISNFNLHDLQNIYYIFTGKELKIEL